MRKPVAIARRIDPKHLERASKVETKMVGPYMEAIVLELHRGLDDWRFGKDPSAEAFKLALDAANALFAEAELRGLA